DVAAAQFAPAPRRSLAQVFTVQAYLAIDHTAWRIHQPQQRKPRDALARSRFADQAQDLARAYRQVYPVNGLDDPGSRKEMRLQAAHFEHGRGGRMRVHVGHAAHVALRGLSTSRK